MADANNNGLGTPAVDTGADPTPYYPSPYPARPGVPDAGGGSGGGGGGNGVVGKDGKSFLPLPRDPKPTDGNDGDTAFNTVTTYVFGPKANGVWPTPGFRLGGNKIYRVPTLPSTASGLTAGDIYIDDLGRLVQIQDS